MYTLTSTSSVLRADGATIPADPNNVDWQAYQAWIAAGNIPAAAPPAVTWGAYQQTARAAMDDSDLTVLRCYENSIALPGAWATYRKSLRAIIGAATGDPTQPLPAKPAYPAGT